MKRAQFFVSTIVLVAMAVSVITNILTIPNELKYRDFEVDLQDVKNLRFVKDTLKNSFNEYFINEWLLPYDSRTIIKVYNNFSLKDNMISMSINLPNDIHAESLILIDENKSRVPFGVSWSNVSEKTGMLYFQSSMNSMDNSKYYLYYNKISSPKKDNEFTESMIVYNDTSEFIDIRTGLYSLRINKSLGGSFDNLNISGRGSVLNFLEARLNCSNNYYNLSESSNQVYTVNDYKYFLEVIITGSRFTNSSYEIKEYFLPDRIIIYDYLTVAANSSCNTWEFAVDVSKSDLSDYNDSAGNSYEPVPEQDEIIISSGDWSTFYDTNYALGSLISSTSTEILLKSTASSNSLILRSFNGSPLTKGTYYNNTLTLLPMHNDSIKINKLNYTVMTDNFDEDLIDEMLILLNILNRYFIQFNSFVTVLVSSSKNLEFYNNRSYWHDNLTKRSSINVAGGDSKNPLVIDGLFSSGFDPNSVELVGREGALVGQLSTNNYLNESMSPLLNNSLYNNSILLLNLDGRDFNVSINKQVTGALSAYTYYPNGTLINFYDVNADFYNIELKNVNQSGFYNVSFNGSNPLFFVNSSSPKLIVGLPAHAHFNELSFVVNESVTEVNMSVNTYSRTAKLIDYLNNTLSTDNGSTLALNSIVSKCLDGCYYKLTLDSTSPALVNSSLRYACVNELFCIDPDNPNINLISYGITSTVPKNFYYYYNTGSYYNSKNQSSDLSYDLSDYEINNSFFSFDLDDSDFIVNGVDWSSGWTTCDPSCVNGLSNIKFLEYGPARVVLYANASNTNYYFLFYYNASMFDVIVNSTVEVTFGPDFKLNNSDTLYYDYLGSGFLNESDTDNYINKVNLGNVINYVRKTAANDTLSVIFKPRDLSYNNSVHINDSTLRLKAYKSGTYRFLINEEPSAHLHELVTNNWEVSSEYNITSYEFSLSEHS